MTAPLHALKVRLDEIEGARQERFEAGEVISGVEVLNPLRTDADWDLLWPIVRALRRDHPAVAVKFPEDTLATMVVDLVRESSTELTLAGLADTLDELADSEGPWLVSTPLANIDLTPLRSSSLMTPPSSLRSGGPNGSTTGGAGTGRADSRCRSCSETT